MIGPVEIGAFAAVLLAAWAAPGPAMLYALRTSLASGRAAGLSAALGLAIVASGWTLAALLGLEGLFALFPWAYGTLKIAGAVYLMWIAWRTWRSADEPVELGATVRRRAFRGGLLLNLGNPKAVLFSAAVIVMVFPPNLGAFEIALVCAIHFALELALYALLAAAVTAPVVSRRYLPAKPWLDRGAAIVMGALGLRLVASR